MRTIIGGQVTPRVPEWPRHRIEEFLVLRFNYFAPEADRGRVERIGAREWAQQGVHWRTIFAWASLLLAHRIQDQRGRPAGAFGASLEVALEHMLLPMIIAIICCGIVALISRR